MVMVANMSVTLHRDFTVVPSFPSVAISKKLGLTEKNTSDIIQYIEIRDWAWTQSHRTMTIRHTSVP